MKRWLVTRHPGAVEWFSRRGYVFDCHVWHLDISDTAPGDVVYGSLPISHVADLCARNVEYWGLCIPMQYDNRGKELSADELQNMGATVKRFWCAPVTD